MLKRTMASLLNKLPGDVADCLEASAMTSGFSSSGSALRNLRCRFRTDETERDELKACGADGQGLLRGLWLLSPQVPQGRWSEAGQVLPRI